MDQIRRAIYKSIGYLGRVIDENGVEHDSPWPTQIEGHESKVRFKAIFAGSRYGKSKWGAAEVLPDIMKPNTRGWIVGPKYEQPSKAFRYIYDYMVIRMGFRPKRELNINYSTPGPQTLIFPWGREVYTKSGSSRPVTGASSAGHCAEPWPKPWPIATRASCSSIAGARPPSSSAGTADLP